MRVVSVDKLKPGWIVGRPVVDSAGAVLLHRDVHLTPDYIQGLKDKGFTRIYIKDPQAAVDIAPDEDLSPVLRSKAMQAMHSVYESIEKELPSARTQSFQDMADACSSETMRALMSAKGPLANIDQLVSSILEEVLTRSTLSGLTSIKSASEPLHAHSLDVCVVSVMIARTCGLEGVRLRQLATGCLLHDIGKVFVDPTLDPVMQVRQHTLLGYELLRNSDNPDILAPHVALEHHEHQDGSGEPRGLLGSNTIERNRDLPLPIPTLIGEIAAVANAYDHLLSGSGQSDPKPPDQALTTLKEHAGSWFNKGILQHFFRVVPVYPVGTEALVLTDPYRNFTAVVTDINPTQLDRPIITVIYDPSNRPISPIQIDLKAKPEVLIRCR